MKVAMSAVLLLLGSTLAQAESAAFGSCMKAAQTTASMSACGQAELKREDARLNQAYKQAMASLEPAQQGKLRDAQRLWLKYRDANCALYYTLTGGTMDILNGGACTLDMTKARADELAGLPEH